MYYFVIAGLLHFNELWLHSRLFQMSSQHQGSLSILLWIFTSRPRLDSNLGRCALPSEP